MLISIVGKSGSGKSYIADVLKSYSENIKHLNIDEIGHQVLLLDSVKEKLITFFGASILTNQEIDRQKLNKIVFCSKEQMQKLTDATWEYMEQAIDGYIRFHQEKIVLLDWQLLPKTKYFENSDLKILVETELEIRKQRAIQRDGITEEKFLEREQASLDFNREDFDYIIENNDFEFTKGKVRQIYDKSIISRKF